MKRLVFLLTALLMSAALGTSFSAQSGDDSNPYNQVVAKMVSSA